MTTATSPDLGTLDRLGHCPECGYLLHGLERGHRCPECGFLPEPELMVLWGWTPAQRGDPAASRPSGKVARVVGWTLLVLYLAFVMWTGEMGLLWTLVAFWAVPAVYYKMRAERAFAAPPRPMQLRISPRGIAERQGFGAVAMLAWGEEVRVELSETAGKGLRIHGYVESSLGYKTTLLCDFEAVLSPEEEAELRRRLTAWVGAAGGRVGRVM